MAKRKRRLSGPDSPQIGPVVDDTRDSGGWRSSKSKASARSCDGSWPRTFTPPTCGPADALAWNWRGGAHAGRLLDARGLPAPVRSPRRPRGAREYLGFAALTASQADCDAIWRFGTCQNDTIL